MQESREIVLDLCDAVDDLSIKRLATAGGYIGLRPYNL